MVEQNRTGTKVSKSMVLLIAGMSSFLTPFTGSSVNIALPSIGNQFSLNAVTLSWVATAYLVAAAVFLVPFGRFADIYGRKRVFMIGVTIDVIGSVLCGALNSGTGLIIFRAVQGLGGAMIFGTGVAILTSVYPVKERGRALGINVAAVYSGLSSGPLIGGLLTQHLGWQSIFYLNALLGIIIIAFVFWKLKDEWAGAKGEKYDFVGAIVYGLGVVLLMYGLSLVPDLSSMLFIVLGIAGLAIFVWWENRQPFPVLKISFFRNNTVFRMSNLAALINYGATFAVTFLLSLYLQYVYGFTPEKTGFILIAQPVIQTLCSPLAGSLSDKLEPRIIASFGMGLTTIGLTMLVFLGDNTQLLYIISCLVILGLGFGFFSSPNTNAIMSSVDRKYYGVASGMVGTMRLTGQMISMMLALMLFAIFIGRVQITPEKYPEFLTSIKAAFIISAVLCLFGIFASIARGKTHQT